VPNRPPVCRPPPRRTVLRAASSQALVSGARAVIGQGPSSSNQRGVADPHFLPPTVSLNASTSVIGLSSLHAGVLVAQLAAARS